MGVPEKKYKYRRDSHGLNVEHATRLEITSTGNHGFPWTPEVALTGCLDIMEDLMGSYHHTSCLITSPNGDDRRPVGEDGNFGEDKELEPYVNTGVMTENGMTKSFEIYYCKATTIVV